MFKFVLPIAFVLYLFAQDILAWNELAKTKCRSLHGMDVDEATNFNNSGCMLNCVIHGQNRTHNVNEGLQCPEFWAGTCQDGHCFVNETHNPPHPINPDNHFGSLSIEMLSAKLVAGLNDYANSFMRVCVQNTTRHASIPLRNLDDCSLCQTDIVPHTAYPVYNYTCTNFNRSMVFINESALTFEVFDQQNSQTRYFLSGASVTVLDILKDGNNNKTMNLAMKHGGSINVRVNWNSTIYY